LLWLQVHQKVPTQHYQKPTQYPYDDSQWHVHIKAVCHMIHNEHCIDCYRRQTITLTNKENIY